MAEQQKQFQKEIIALKKQFEAATRGDTTLGLDTQSMNGNEDNEGDVIMDADIAADLALAREHFKNLAANTDPSSPVTKRTRRSKSRQCKSGGGHPSTMDSLNE